jgi:lipase ATG15
MYTVLAITSLVAVALGFLFVFAFWYSELLWIVVLAEAAIFAVVAILNNFVVFGWGVGLITLVLVVATQSFLIRKVGLTFPMIIAIVALFLSIAAMIFYMGYYANTQQPDSSTQQMWGTNHFSSAKRHDPYSFCEHTWHGLRVLDYALFSKLAYYDPRNAHLNEIFGQDLAAFFPTGGWTNREVPANFLTGVTFRDIYSSALNLSVIAVRGTAGKSDVIQDMDIWVTVTLFQAASYVGPSFLQGATKDIIYWATFMKRTLKSPEARFYYEKLDDYIASIAGRQSAIVLTGHSLGGGLAKIVGARNKLHAITFSGPGLEYTSRSVEVTTDALHHYAVSIVPDKDVVPRVDVQSASVLPIECDQDVMSCHFINRSICELMRTCVDPTDRGLNTGFCPNGYF